MFKTHLKPCPTSFIFRGMQIKNNRLGKPLTTPCVGEDEKKLDLACMVGERLHHFSYFGKQVIFFMKANKHLLYAPAVLLLDVYQRGVKMYIQ